MLKKENEVKLNEETRKSFNKVKFALSQGHELVSTNYTSDFIIFSFASEHSIAVVFKCKEIIKVWNNRLDFPVEHSKMLLLNMTSWLKNPFL